jgi:hypothetical protein
MIPSVEKPDHAPRRRRYVVYLFCAHDETNGACGYIARIQPWAARMSARTETRERVFTENVSSSKPLTRCFLAAPTSVMFLVTSRAPTAFSISSISTPSKRRVWAGACKLHS